MLFTYTHKYIYIYHSDAQAAAKFLIIEELIVFIVDKRTPNALYSIYVYILVVLWKFYEIANS